ncbi:MAG TPA: hypothetical protein VFD91_16920, partial [Mariniphaga sp.]|nr:hypothetical protein [Mariniphaga sp.]
LPGKAKKCYLNSGVVLIQLQTAFHPLLKCITFKKKEPQRYTHHIKRKRNQVVIMKQSLQQKYDMTRLE